MDVLSIPQVRSTQTEVNVVYTTAQATRSALATARAFSKDLDIKVRVLAFQVVPFPLQIDEPAVASGFAVDQILEDLEVPDDTEFTLQYSLCRDANDALLRSLKSQSLVVIGGRTRIVPSRELRIARKLQSVGHEVVFVPIKPEMSGLAILHAGGVRGE